MKLLDEEHVSLDIEACGEVVLSIGACVFDPRTGEAGDKFYCVPSFKDQMAAGLRPDADAWLWLLRQSDQARKAISEAQASARQEFVALDQWLYPRRAWVWAYPTSFDLPVIQRAMAAFGMKAPWTWTKTMDGRTLWQLAIARDPAAATIERETAGIEHHALSDAEQQARWYARYLAIIGGGTR